MQHEKQSFRLSDLSLFVFVMVIYIETKHRELTICCFHVHLQGHPAVRPELDLVEQEDQLTHELSLEEEIDPEITLGMSYLMM